jgi:hypothetical protein
LPANVVRLLSRQAPRATIKRRRVEISAFERERVVVRPAPMPCPVCRCAGEWLTVAQAAALVQVKTRSIRRWLVEGKAHDLRPAG